jgi:prepilin peptidase CpaA
MFQFALVFIVVGFGLYMFKIMGGGDSKFLATFFLLIPLNFQEQVFYYLLIITIIVGLIIFINNLIVSHEKIIESIKNKNIDGIKSCFGSKFAYAPVILITWIWFGWTIYIN